MTNAAQPQKSKRSLLQRYAAAPHMVWSVLFVIAPLIFVVYYAFTNADGAFTVANVAEFFTPTYLKIFGRSVKMSLIATAICLVIGYPIAYFISRCKPKTQRILTMLLMLPMWMNFLIRTYAIMVLIQDTGIINGFLGKLGIGPFHMLGTEGAVILGMVYDYLPYMILPIYSVMAKLDHRLVEAAADLGCNGFGVLRKVIIPLSLSGVISGVTMVLVPSISTFYISQKLGGGTFELIGDTIERQFVTGALNVGAAISLVMMALILISRTVMNKFTDSDDGGIIV